MHFEMDWLAGGNAHISEELLTRCRLSLNVSDQQLFRHEDLLGEHQVKDAILVSAYPLALWFAANWWRLRWESSPISNAADREHDWCMSHSLAAAGNGYAWPSLTFTSDGDNIHLDLQPDSERSGPLRYLERLDTWVTANVFEAGIDQFVTHTLQHLEGSSVQTELKELWHILSEERACSATALLRQLEARLGYDAEEAPQAMLDKLKNLMATRGEEAIQELASLGHHQAEQAIEEIEQRLAHAGETIKLPFKNLAKAERLITESRPWAVGYDAARELRKRLALDAGPLSNRRFADLLEAPVQLLEDSTVNQPMAIGIGEMAASEKARVSLGKKRKDARRFMAARLVAEGLNGGEVGRWLPCTNTATARQKYQRAFAQEFLCPYQDLIDWMDTTSPEEELLQAAAEHFEVSPLLVNHVMINHGHLARASAGALQ